MSFLVAPGDAVTLSLTLEDAQTSGVFPRAFVYDAANTLLATVDLTHVANGRWTGSYTTPSTGGVFTVHYVVYGNAGHTLIDPLHGASEDRIITDWKMIWNELRANSGGDGTYGQAIKVALGITAKANMRIDKTVYDSNGFLEQARIRIFETSAAATSATVDAADGADGEIWRVNLTGVADLVHLTLPDNVLGVLS